MKQLVDPELADELSRSTCVREREANRLGKVHFTLNGISRA